MVPPPKPPHNEKAMSSRVDLLIARGGDRERKDEERKRERERDQDLYHHVHQMQWCCQGDAFVFPVHNLIPMFFNVSCKTLKNMGRPGYEATQSIHQCTLFT